MTLHCQMISLNDNLTLTVYVHYMRAWHWQCKVTVNLPCVTIYIYCKFIFTYITVCVTITFTVSLCYVDSMEARSAPSVTSVSAPLWMISRTTPSRVRTRLEETPVGEDRIHSRTRTHLRRVGYLKSQQCCIVSRFHCHSML